MQGHFAADTADDVWGSLKPCTGSMGRIDFNKPVVDIVGTFVGDGYDPYPQRVVLEGSGIS